MNLVLLLPLGLAALAAWLVPLLIHLRRRSEQQRTPFAALRWLPARARPRSRLRFEEWPLLLLRLLLLAGLALLLAQPVLFGAPHAKRWVVLVPGADRTALPSGEKGVEYRWLAPGFPALDRAAAQSPQPVGSLLRELDATLPGDTQLTVLVPAQIDGADAVRPVLHRAVQWRIVAGKPAGATKLRPQRAAGRPPLSVRYAEGRADAVRYLRAASIAWQAATPAEARGTRSERTPASDIGPIDHSLPTIDRPLVWLSPGRLSAALLAWTDKGGTVLVGSDTDVPDMERRGISLLRDDEGNVLVRGLPRGRGRLLQWTRPLSPDSMPLLLEPEFPERLWQLFAPRAPAAPTRVMAADYQPVIGGRAWPEVPRDLQPWLLLVIAGLFVIERWFASGRREAAAE